MAEVEAVIRRRTKLGLVHHMGNYDSCYYFLLTWEEEGFYKCCDSYDSCNYIFDVFNSFIMD